ncbi:adenylate/guanylate cyclase domain-containing protein [Microvirga solisilvae]|uniref:adenylate/guanylate cyclase domain-containing protein n=1 Tax=Microvirga solisilvae TaxID=2919498 RepID=UPI001FAECD96|nr:adenylate/guanylate cyclase domain-containing protein [Microvirga solisilvae]
MALEDDLKSEFAEILLNKFDVRDGRVVPNSEDLALRSEAVKIEATFLYADLAGSSKLSRNCAWDVTAKIIRAYLHLASKLIRLHGGEIRSFDGDRVMGVFIGANQANDAVACAQKIDWMIYNWLSPVALNLFNLQELGFTSINHCIGIDSGIAHAVRAGIRNNNDLIWVGQPPSFAAKLSDIRTAPYEVYTSETVMLKLSNQMKFPTGANAFVWLPVEFEFAGGKHTVYCTHWMLRP